MEQEEKKDGNYALNTFEDIRKYDWPRFLDLGNDFQVLVSRNNRKIDEEARASSNFEKLTEDRRRPISHTLVDATRLLPDIIAFAGPAKAIAKKAIAKKAAKDATSKVAKKIVNENTSDIAQAFNNSKLLRRDAKNDAAKRWVRNLYENKEAMNRVAGKSLSDDEIKAIRKELPNAVTEKIKKYNAGVDELKTITDNIKGVQATRDLDIIGRDLIDNQILTRAEWEKIGRNLAELPEYDKGISFSHVNVDRILKEIPKEKRNTVKDILKRHFVDNKISVKAGVKKLDEAIKKVPMLTFLDIEAKLADANINKMAKTNYQANKELEIKPDYFARGSEPTPLFDFIASLFNVDFNDPARFNKKDIDTFFDFLENEGYIEPGIKDKWTPRQKVSVMREILNDKVVSEDVKGRWAESKYKENLSKYYNNKGE